MNLFRSEEHARDWEEYDPAMAHLVRPVEWWADTFSAPMFRERGRSDFISWVTSPEASGTFAELRERMAPPRPDVRATTAAAIALSNVEVSVVDGASPDDRSVEQQLFGQWPAAVPVEIARHWRNTARAMIVAIPAEPLSDVDQQLWTETRRSAVRDIQAATGWLARADVGAGDVRLTHRLAQMGWQGQVADQPAWTAMEQSARAILKCRALAEFT
ncbi:MAG: hypothetical protein F4117_03020 [Acidimicrobiales bacterium]|nr:hypothetical protein [Acidimicrobiales bacterium]MXZ15250.1 hypothetical protein [Acidimicrobiales bacterium]MYB81699.1 hypothetical protein [Acidimicrobiales bacterium]MYI11522.1 hypothetical protein [Acidimicrobiales bacterium]MYJ48675.1 hypothetical protein [Acidimicrobiales bacterium]